jgi:peptidyl-prolyl cis-trans isomerase D
MIISSMNRFFTKHGRVTFFIIAAIVIVTFVLFMTGQSVFSLFSERYSSPGDTVILGRSVSRNEISSVIDNMLIQQAINSENATLGRVDYQAAQDAGIRTMLLIYAAQDAGLAVGDKEVAEAIEKATAFQKDGKFDKAKYEKFIKEQLKLRHFTKHDLDEAVRKQLLVEKFTKSVTDNVVCSEDEIKDAFFRDNTKAKVETVEFKFKDYLKEVKVKDSEAKSYFESNKDKYKTKPACKIMAVAFKVEEFKPEALKSITDDEVKKYYEDHKAFYLKKDSKKKDSKKKDDKKKEYKPLKEVEAQIKTTLANKKAKDLAHKAATKYSDEIYDMTKDVFYEVKDADKALETMKGSFGKFAEKSKKEVINTGWVEKGSSDIKGLGKEPKIVSTALELLDNPLSESIKGWKGSYVILVTGKREPQPESFENIKKEIIEDLKKEKAVNMAREKARDASLKLSEALKKGKKLKDAAKKLKVTFKPMPMEITPANPPWVMNGRVIQQATCSTPEGQVSPSEDISDGAMLVYVQKRTYPTMKEYEEQKKQFAERYKMMKRYTVWNDYFEKLAERSNITVKK